MQAPSSLGPRGAGTRAAWLILLTLVPLGCQNSNAPAPVYLGHVTQFHMASMAGESAMQGIRLALHDFPEAADVFQGRPVQVRHTDTRGKPEAYEAQAVRLVAVSRAVALIGGTSVDEAARLAKAEVPVLTFLGHAPPDPAQVVFPLGMAPQPQGKALAAFLVQEQKTTGATLFLDERRAESPLLAQAFAAEFARLRGGDGPAAIRTVRIGEKPAWAELVAKLEPTAGHAVVFAGAAADFEGLRSALAGVASEAPLAFAGSDLDAASLTAGDRPVYLATAYFDDPGNAGCKAFREAFVAANASEPDLHACLGFEATRIAVQALRQSGGKSLKEELARPAEYTGVAGPLSLTSDRVVRRSLFVLRLQNGARTLAVSYTSKAETP